MTYPFSKQTPSESHLSVIGEDFEVTIYGADAQDVWREMSNYGPVLRCPTGAQQIMTVTADASREALRDPVIFSSSPEGFYFGSETGAIPLQVDPPKHSSYRKLLDPMFTPKIMNAREPEMIAIVNRLIDSFIANGKCDFATDFAIPFPSEMFLNLMGLPMEELPGFLRAKDMMIRPEGSSEEERNAVKGEASMWIVNLINSAMSERDKKQGDDILSYFWNLEQQGVLTREETLNICVLFVPAGLDTVTDSLEMMFAYLAQNPSQRQEILDNPDCIHLAVEELLRYETPVPGVVRVTKQDTEIQGCPIAKGTQVRVNLAAINLSDSTVPNPFEVDFAREANPHVAFGAGIHRCVGSYLARIELRVAMREWHKRIPNYQIEPGHVLQYRQGLREFNHMPLVFPAQ
jgi:cytochrome P450